MRRFAITLVAAATLAASATGQTAMAGDDTREANANPTAQATPQASAPPQDENGLPPNYRRFVAAALLGQYLTDSDGPPEISAPWQAGIFRKAPHLIVRFPLSRTGAHGMLITFRDPPPRRYRCIMVEADRTTFTDKRYFSFRHPRNDPGDICDTHIAFEPFTELAQMAAKVRGCRERGESQCVVAEAVTKTGKKTPDRKTPDAASAPASAKKQAKAKPPRKPASPAEASAEP